MKCFHSGSGKRFLEPCLLVLLHSQDDYGYNLMTRLTRYGFDESYPDAGTLYRVLREMEQSGFITSSWKAGESGPAKRIYSLTDAGREALNFRISILKHNLTYISLLVRDVEGESP